MVSSPQPRLKVVHPPVETVVLLHGMLASRRSMGRLEDALAGCGYSVVNWGYRSLSGSIAKHAERLSRLLERLDADRAVDQLHFVTHSMGGIILRCALHNDRPSKSGRIVMLAPPNAGSRLAGLPLGPLQKWFPQICELSKSADSLVNLLPEPTGLEVGVIAASNDFVVDVGATRLACQRDHIVVSSTHQQLPARWDTGRHVISFLRHGRFRPVATRLSAAMERMAA